jgi:hypothetical protein
VLAHEDARRAARRCSGQGCNLRQGQLELHWGHTLYHIDDLPLAEDLSDMPDGYALQAKGMYVDFCASVDIRIDIDEGGVTWDL